ncbi:MAG: dTDP-4-dehydrorhamnose reductase [Candidatus Schekmanbacteria bacterium]|nr:MAG: dTDP-4-dehydrorhamnose reductase [Candidatus Schekmanbacteria bacterium]
MNSQKKKKIAVLGARGMLGQAMTRIVSENHFDTRGFAISEVDITKPDTIAEMFDRFSPQVVINCAAFTDVDACETERERAMKVNAEGVYNIAEISNKRNALVVHISTDYIFDGTKKSPYKEEDIPSPLNFYGESKYLGEKSLIEATDDYIILRTEWLYGEGGKNFVFTMLDKQKRGEIIEVVDDQIGSPTLTDEVAYAVVGLLNNNCRGVYNFSSAGECSWYDFAKKIFEVSGLPAQINAIKSSMIKRPAVRPKYSVLDCSKIKRDANISIKVWDEALSAFIRNLKLK